MNFKRIFSALVLPLAALASMPVTMAQDADDEVIEEVVAVGIRGSLRNSVETKRNSENLIEAIYAEDIGKLPDQNLAEVLENVTGIQIIRTAGVGTGVQIRGTDSNRTEINGVSTVGSGAGRSGIDFEDVSAAIISSVEVVKAPEAKTIEGSVGGTINLKTIRPLQLKETLAAFRIQGEDSSLSTESGLSPRVSGSWGDNWSTDSGDFGVVISGSWSEQDVSAFRPRVDRDNYVAAGDNPSVDFQHLPIQFLNQELENFNYETVNVAASFEWAPRDELTLYFDTVLNDQESRQRSSRVQASGVSNLRFDANITEFETVNFGTLDGENGVQELGSIQAAARGVIPAQGGSPWDPNLRVASDTNQRYTDAKIFRLGGDWQINDRLSTRVEVSTSDSDSTTPYFNTVINFINPNVPSGSPNENGTPFEFDLTGGSLTFGIAQGEANAPTAAELLDPANYRLRDVNQSRDKAENSEDAFRADFTVDMTDSSEFVTSFDVGYRYNETTSYRDQIRSNIGLRNMDDAPPGDLFASILTAGPNNFNEADGRRLYMSDFLVVDPEQAASNPDGVLSVLNDAMAAHHAITGSTRGGIDTPSSSASAFFDISEKTHALYAQASFASGIFRGNVGLRYLETDVASTGNRVINGVPTPTTTKGSYGFALPRFNLVADVAEDVVVRFGWAQDIRRPNFDDLSTSFTFSTSPNPPVELGNPDLKPEEVTSIDLSVEWYFAPGSVLSVGYFNKKRSGIFFPSDTDPVEDENGFRDTTPPCEGGGIFNPIADPNVFAPPGTPPGVCVPTSQTINGAGTSTQQGVELAFQYDLAEFEDRLGWASGFGVIANYTSQTFGGSDEYFSAFSRPTTVFNALGATDVVTWRGDLLNLSENAYNFTLYYEKYDLSARMRYTWREAYRSDDYVGTSSPPWGFPVVNDDRGQLNASVNYYVTDNLNLGIEAVNLTEEDVMQYCVNKDALLCYQGLADRRITFGVAYRF